MLKIDWNNEDLLYDAMYDTIYCVAGINITILQTQFNRALCFNTENFCLKELNYNFNEMTKMFSDIRDEYGY